MPVPDEIKQLRKRIEALEAELQRVKAQRNKAWRDRADLHARLLRISAYQKEVDRSAAD